jgi:hypothetical protein
MRIGFSYNGMRILDQDLTFSVTLALEQHAFNLKVCSRGGLGEE